MGFACGIVGLPNVGKSTLFNALTQAGIAAANYPFCTIEPNTGVVPVPDPRLQQLANIVSPERIIPTSMQFVDIAGLVAGASKGEGLGNQFLAHIREVDAIAHVVRCFEHKDVVHVNGNVDPLRDIEVIHTELALSDLAAVDRALIRVQKLVRSGDKTASQQIILLERTRMHLDQALPARTMTLTEEERIYLRGLFLLTLKPTLYVANVDESGFQNNPLLDAVKTFALQEQAPVVSICASLESEISELSEQDRSVFLSDLGLESPGLDRLIRAGHELLGLQTFFTAGVKEVRAWTIPIGAIAPQAAGVIHTDFEQGFIRAEVISFDDFIQYKGEAGAKQAGRLRLEGKKYIVCDGDVIHFLFNV